MASHSSNAAAPLSPQELTLMKEWWNAANYLTVGQIYLQENVLLHEALQTAHIKPRLLGHWGTSPGISLLYVQLNRIIKRDNTDVLFLVGPGHGGPALVANVWLEGRYTEVYPKVSQDAKGIRTLFRQFSTPGGIPSHCSPDVPGSIHEGGELGYVLMHAFGAVFDQPNVVALAIVGDGEAETGPLEGSWKGISFLNPVHDGAVLPVLHLNGYKIAGPTVLGRESNENIEKLFSGYGYKVYFVEGHEVDSVFQQMASVLDICMSEIRAIQKAHREGKAHGRPRWPLIIMRTPKGWTGPHAVDGVQVEGTFRSHQVPLSNVRDVPDHIAILEKWLKSYEPHTVFDKDGHFRADLAALAPVGNKRMSAQPCTNPGLEFSKFQVPDFTKYAVPVDVPCTKFEPNTFKFGCMLRDCYMLNPTGFRLFCPDETNSNKVGAVFERENRCLVSKVESFDDHVKEDGRVMEVLSEHNCSGWLEGYILTGRRGIFVTYEAFALIVTSMIGQMAKWYEVCGEAIPWRKEIPSYNILLTSTCWRNDHNGFSHQGPGLLDSLLTKKGCVIRIYLPPDSNTLLAVGDVCLRSNNTVNCIVIDKQPHFQFLDIEAARQHVKDGASIWKWACNHIDRKPDIVLASAGDVPTQELIAAANILRKKAPGLAVRVVNIVDIMSLYTKEFHPSGMTAQKFTELFTDDVHVIFSYHSYAGGLHQLLHRRPHTDRFHVRGYMENGTTTTPFDMVVLNHIDRFRIVRQALQRCSNPPANTGEIMQYCSDMLQKHHDYIREHFEDLPEVNNWKWEP